MDNQRQFSFLDNTDSLLDVLIAWKNLLESEQNAAKKDHLALETQLKEHLETGAHETADMHSPLKKYHKYFVPNPETLNYDKPDLKERGDWLQEAPQLYHIYSEIEQLRIDIARGESQEAISAFSQDLGLNDDMEIDRLQIEIEQEKRREAHQEILPPVNKVKFGFGDITLKTLLHALQLLGQQIIVDIKDIRMIFRGEKPRDLSLELKKYYQDVAEKQDELDTLNHEAIDSEQRSNIIMAIKENLKQQVVLYKAIQQLEALRFQQRRDRVFALISLAGIIVFLGCIFNPPLAVLGAIIIIAGAVLNITDRLKNFKFTRALSSMSQEKKFLLNRKKKVFAEQPKVMTPPVQKKPAVKDDTTATLLRDELKKKEDD